MSRDELGRRVGKKYSYIAELENGGMKSSTKLHTIADALGLNAAWLETGKGEKFSQPKPQSQSQSLKLDPMILAESIAACRSLAKRQGWDYDPQFNADVTCDAYALRLLLPDAPSQTDVIDFGQKVAERLAREFGNGSEGGSGAGAATGGNDRGGLEASAGTRKARAAGGAK